MGAGDIPRCSVLRWRASLLAPNRDPGDVWPLGASRTLRKPSVTVTQSLDVHPTLVWTAQRARPIIRFFWWLPADDRLPG